MSFETPRSTVTSARSVEGRDDRFYTPRLSSQSSTASDEWASSRLSDGEFSTPRDHLIQDRSYLVDKSYSNVHKSASNRSFKSVRSRDEMNHSQPYHDPSSLYKGSQTSLALKYLDSDERDSIAIDMIQPSQDDIEMMFSYARHDRREEIERYLDRGIPVDIRDEYGNTMLVTACQNNNKRMAKVLLRRGANINARNYRGNTPLHYCYHYGYGDSLGEYLISKGADATIRNKFGKLCLEGI